MTDNDSMIIPAGGLLDSVLAEAADARQDFGQTTEFLVNKSVEVVQSKGTRHALRNVEKLYVGGKDVAEGVYVPQFSFILVDTLYDTIPSGKYMVNRGARQMWEYVREDGGWKRNIDSGGPACSSANGLQPRAEFLGKELIDIRDESIQKIGFKKDAAGEWVPETDKALIGGEEHISVCPNCPLGQWKTAPDGKRQPPPCAEAWGYVVYVLPHDPNDTSVPESERITEGFLAIIRGNNSGVQLALAGARAGSPAARIDGAAFMGIVAPFRSNPSTKNFMVTRPVGSITNAQLPNVLGFCVDEKQTGFVAAKMRNADNSINPVFTGLRNNTEAYPYVVLTVPTYQYAPKGLPEDAGPEAPVFRVNMRVAQNGYKLGSRANPTLVPEVLVTDKPLSIEEYAGYLKARTLYKTTGQRKNLMRFDLLPVVDEALLTGVMPASPDSVNESTSDANDIPF